MRDQRKQPGGPAYQMPEGRREVSLLAGKLPNGWVVSVVVLVASLAAQMGVSLLGQWSFKPNSVALARHTPLTTAGHP